MKSNENKITTYLNGSFAVPFTMTIRTIVISDQDCFDGEWNALLNKGHCAEKKPGYQQYLLYKFGIPLLITLQT